MTKSRLEAFSDGLFAILITIMVLELKIPKQPDIHALVELLPEFTTYVLSFIFLGIYWGNHHHLLHTVHYVNSKIIWANMALLFCLSLVPFTTGWMGENHFAGMPVALYAVNLLLCAISFYVLQQVIMSHYTHSTKLIEALKKQKKKGMFSLVCYALAILFAFYFPWISWLIFVFTGVLWVIPDRNIEQALKE